jgi:4-amino-4-deoxychorismate lyase
VESALREGGRQPGLRLIETMLWDGAEFPRGFLHLDRLGKGRQVLGWAKPGRNFFARYDGPRLTGPARVRMTVGPDDDVAWEVSDLPLAKPEWRVGLAEGRLWSGDPWLTVKSTRRRAYDAARAGLADGLDEVIFLNERGEVCDGTITTVFFDRGQGMRTPPLSSGLLPGVLRAEIRCSEEVLMAEDLPRVRLWVGNALRGLTPAIFCP